ncbi:MAG TPA: VOC family protein [Caulobacteraceae bacterium]|jgi:catechol 2,3-dioxygenase-like lactoylglutathione lyase family enzyme|nr:VOC family protein [Caulobacteraceae bacterium]
MIDHLGFYVRDAGSSLAFYAAALAPLGIEVVQEQPEFNARIYMRRGGVTFLWLGEPDRSNPRIANPGLSPVHIGFAAASPAAVDAFHAAALAAGGRDNGAPGYRRPACYGAFVFDPDDNNIEAVWQTERVAVSG